MIRITALLTIILIAGSIYAGAQDFRQRLSTPYSSTDEIGDVEAEISFGEQVAARIAGTYPVLRDKKLTRYLSLVGNHIASYSKRPELTFYFAVLDTPEINAFAAPGGYIFVTKGALLLMKNESELAGVLAHEIGHVVEKHIVKELKIIGNDKSGVATASLLSGATDSVRIAFQQLVDKATEILFKRGYKQEDEFDADYVGTILAAEAGYADDALLSYVRRMSTLSGKSVEKISETHPASVSRIKQLDKMLSNNSLNANPQLHTRRFSDHVHAALQ